MRTVSNDHARGILWQFGEGETAPFTTPLPLVLKPAASIPTPSCNDFRTRLHCSLVIVRYCPVLHVDLIPREGGERGSGIFFGCTNYLMGKRKAVQSLARPFCSVYLSSSFPFFRNSRPCRRALNSRHIGQSLNPPRVNWSFRVMQMNVILLFCFLFFFLL